MLEITVFLYACVIEPHTNTWQAFLSLLEY